MLATLLSLLPQQPTAPTPLQFSRQTLSTQFLCEGAACGDLDGDGDLDVVAGPWWYEGPDFTTRHALYPAKVFHPLKYSDNFFAWVHDLDGDGDQDVFVVGFPGERAGWHENVGKGRDWPRHFVFDGVDNESPWFVDLTGDGRPDLVCQHQDHLGWAEPDGDPRRPWRFRRAFGPGAGPKFTHGLGVGDVDGDGRMDLLHKLGWLRHPASLDGDPQWPLQATPFSQAYGGAQMLVLDVDGDGKNDVVTADAAHHYGLVWYRQGADGSFTAHELLPRVTSAANVSAPHALCLSDLDGVGLLDVVTGKRWWSHGPSQKGNADGADDAPLLLGFLLRRDAAGPRFERVTIDAETGVGTQITAGDLDGDGRADLVVGNKRGTFVLRQATGGDVRQDPVRVQPDLTFESGTLRGWVVRGDAFLGQPVRGDAVKARRDDMTSGHAGEYWIGGYEQHGDDAVGTMTSVPFVVSKPWATFLVAGGGGHQTRVDVLAADDTVIASAHGDDHETLRPVIVDLREHVGKPIRIHLVDEKKGHWGHLNFDEFVFHDQQPGTGVPEQAVGKSPAEAAAAMTTPPGFHVDLIAGEPQLHQPVALWVDERSRLWVAEAYSYPGKVGDERARDTLVVFEDRDQDGSFESRTVFHDKFDLISGFAVGHGGVWVGAAPHLFFVPDRNRDLVPDGPPEVVLDGWGLQDTHETLNSFTWGPDGWLYGTHGVFTHSKVGAPGTPDADRVPLNAGVWRLEPKSRRFEVFAWGTSNPWGVDFDDRGQAFLACCVIDHLWHMVPGSRSQRQGGTHFDAYPWLQLGTIADHRHYVGKTSDHAWWNGRNRPVADVGTDLAGGGHAHCGTLVYKGDAFPAEYRNAVLFANIHGNRINHDRLRRDGSGYLASHAPDLVRANDPWFRGVALRQGANGEVFFIDWYDKNACHRTTPEIWDRTNGRLYRLRYGDQVPTATVALDQLDDTALAGLCAADNDFVGAHARRLLGERPDVDVEALGVLRAGLRASQDGLVNLRCLWALRQSGALSPDDLRFALAHAHEDVRGWAVRLLAEDPERFPTLLATLPAHAARETSVSVRLELAAALQRLRGDVRWQLAEALLQFADDDQDRNLPNLLWYGCLPLCAGDPARFVRLVAATHLSKLRRLLWRRAAVDGDAARALLVQEVARTPELRLEILAAFAEAQRERPDLDAPDGWATLAPTLLAVADAAVRQRAADAALAFGDGSLAPLFRERLADPQVATDKRLQTLEALVRLRDADTGPLLARLLDDAAVRRAALAGLANYDLPAATQRILAVLPQLEPTDREVALTTLASRAASAKALLDAMLAETVSQRLLDAVSLRRQLQALGDREVDTLLQRAWGRSLPPNENAAAEIARHKQLLTPEFLAGADHSSGRAIYARTCQACHKLYDVGGTIGPDLTGSNRKDLDYLLANIVDPSAEVGRDYQLVTVRLRDGRTLTGNVLKETKTTVTVRTLAGTSTLRRDELAAAAPGRPALEYSSLSMIPPGQLLALSQHEIRDLLGYLMGSNQAPIDASPENLGSFFDGESLAGWQADPAVWSVEHGEIVGRTTKGLAHNNFAVSELRLRDFRLVFEVKLTADTANSGVQFRSVPLPDGEMQGYQADIGKGWWGLLYEESGRGVLQKPAAAVERPGEWNTYEILAVGDRIQLALNGVRTVDLVDPAGQKRGVVGLQVHSGGPTEVRFRNFRLELAPEPTLQTLR